MGGAKRPTRVLERIISSVEEGKKGHKPEIPFRRIFSLFANESMMLPPPPPPLLPPAAASFAFFLSIFRSFDDLRPALLFRCSASNRPAK